MGTGKLFVIDGQDGTGKATQAALLVKRLQEEGYRVETLSFPQYNSKSAGPAEEYLRGAYGSAEEVNAYQASVLFAVDRFAAKKQLQTWLHEGACVVLDRYVGSNMGHQGSKISDPLERKKFFAWALAFEHDLMGIPRPDINIILHLPSTLSQTLSQERGGWKGSIDNDIHETNAAHLLAAEQTYLELPQIDPHFCLVECLDAEKALLSKERIHEQIWSLLLPLLPSSTPK